ncbi:MAG: F0F1 ATP synthase subunit A [Patescibacteria group bacterium]
MASSSDIHISIAPETIFHFGQFEITNAMLGSILVCAVLCAVAIIAGGSVKKNSLPGKLQNAIEWYYVTIQQSTSENIGSASKARPYLGLVLTLFLFILLSSWLGLIPGVLHIGVVEADGVLAPIFRAPTTDLNATIALALIAFITIQYAGFKSQGVKYLGKFFNFKNGPINFYVGLQELISELARLISFSFRLFGNIFAGEVLIVVLSSMSRIKIEEGPFAFLSAFGLPIPSFVILMEFFVAILQAYVFVTLMSVFISLATEDSHH